MISMGVTTPFQKRSWPAVDSDCSGVYERRCDDAGHLNLSPIGVVSHGFGKSFCLSERLFYNNRQI